MNRLPANLGPTLRPWRVPAHSIVASWVFVAAVLIATGQEPEHPLRPPDRSSPRAALKTFLEEGDTFGSFLAQDYLRSPSRAAYHQLISLTKDSVQGLNLSEVPPAGRDKAGRAAVVALYETLNRIQLPPFGEIPDAGQLSQSGGSKATDWVIPYTEIAFARVESGPRQGEFLFSPETVAHANDFYERVRDLPYIRPVPLENLEGVITASGGWLVPHRWIRALPAWLQFPLAGQTGWKWIGLVLVLGGFTLSLKWVHRLARWRSEERPFLQALAAAALPAFLLLATPTIAYLALVQINLYGDAGSTIKLAATAVMFLAGAWISWRLAPVAAEAIIASPQIASDSIDASLIRICARLLGIFAGGVFLTVGADRLGVPLYGIVAGVGIGGVAIALAAQSTIENLIGGLSLFADRPIQLGNFCKYGDEIGTVEAIGIRSTRIRGLDRTLTTIPNGVLAKIPIVNFAKRERLLIKSVIGVRYETSPEQLRYLLVKIREMLLGHPHIHPDPARARFIGYGASSLDIEVFAYVTTTDWAEFLEIREEILLRVMDIIKASGSGFALPSQTLFFARDLGLDANRTDAAEAQVRKWREDGMIPPSQTSNSQE